MEISLSREHLIRFYFDNQTGSYGKAINDDSVKGEFANFVAEVYEVLDGHLCPEQKMYHIRSIGRIPLRFENINDIQSLTEQLNTGIAKLVNTDAHK
jgi:hypothetical protein